MLIPLSPLLAIVPSKPLILYVKTPVIRLLTILSITAFGIACTHSLYTSTDNSVHYSYWYYLYSLRLHFYWQLCPLQPLVLPVPSTLTLLLPILSTTATGIACTNFTYISSDNTVTTSLVLPLQSKLTLLLTIPSPQPLVLPVQSTLTLLLTIQSTTAIGIACTDSTYISTDNTFITTTGTTFTVQVNTSTDNPVHHSHCSNLC